jgi:acetolactate synthase small subunit
MTKKLEELLNVSPEDEAEDKLPIEVDPEDSKDQIEQLEKNLKEVDNIEKALSTVELDDRSNDTELDEIAGKADSTFDNLMDLGMNVEARFSGQIFDTASKMLQIKLNAKQSKVDKKLKMLELQIRKKALDARIERDSGQNGAVNGEATVISRNELLDRILKKDNK